MKKVKVFTDGACLGNPGPGGWACLLRYQGHTKQAWGAEAETTNNRMELTAAVKALEMLREPCEVELTTDSNYLKNGITTWIHNWKRNGWRNASKKPVRNQDLWRRLDEAAARHKTIWRWTKGHAGHAENELCDEIATRAAREQSSGEKASHK